MVPDVDDDPGPTEVWTGVLDFIALVADSLDLSGWSLGVCCDGGTHTYTRGFDADVAARYAVIAAKTRLPGPMTVMTGRDQYFRTSEEAHSLYPLSADIDGEGRHEAAAVFALRAPAPAPAPAPAVGYLALHFGSEQQFHDDQRRRLERLAETVTSAMPLAALGPAPSAPGVAYDGMAPEPRGLAAAMRRHALTAMAPRPSGG